MVLLWHSLFCLQSHWSGPQKPCVHHVGAGSASERRHHGGDITKDSSFVPEFSLTVWSNSRISCFHVFCRLNAITKVMQHRNVKLFSGCSSTREQCRATTWCLRKRTWRQPTKVDLSVGVGGVEEEEGGCSETGPDVRQLFYGCSSAPCSFFFFCRARSGLRLDLAHWNQ